MAKCSKNVKTTALQMVTPLYKNLVLIKFGSKDVSSLIDTGKFDYSHSGISFV